MVIFHCTECVSLSREIQHLIKNVCLHFRFELKDIQESATCMWENLQGCEKLMNETIEYFSHYEEEWEEEYDKDGSWKEDGSGVTVFHSTGDWGWGEESGSGVWGESDSDDSKHTYHGMGTVTPSSWEMISPSVESTFKAEDANSDGMAIDVFLSLYKGLRHLSDLCQPGERI